MLRLLVLLLLLANVGYLAWTQAWLPATRWLGSAAPAREPQRLQQQLRPERIVLLTAPAEPAPTPPRTSETVTTEPAPAPADADTRCLQTPPLTDRQFTALNKALGDVKADSSMTVLTTIVPGRWIVYSGKLASAAALTAYKADLRQLKIPFRDLTTPALQPGVAMGTYSSEANAEQALRDVSRAGVKNAKVVAERPEVTQYTVRLPEATPAKEAQLRQALDSLPSDLGRDTDLMPCP